MSNIGCCCSLDMQIASRITSVCFNKYLNPYTTTTTTITRKRIFAYEKNKREKNMKNYVIQSCWIMKIMMMAVVVRNSLRALNRLVFGIDLILHDKHINISDSISSAHHTHDIIIIIFIIKEKQRTHAHTN